MTDDEFELYLQPLHSDQVEAICGLRDAISKHAPGLEERINDGTWLPGLIFYLASASMIYAIGTRGRTKTTLHMMPYYGSLELQTRHRDARGPFLAGKSCIAFRLLSDVPMDALIDILERGTPIMLDMTQVKERKESPSD